MVSIRTAAPSHPTPDPGALKLELDRRGNAAVIYASGEIDLATAPELEAVLARAIRRSAMVRLDLSEVTFMDSSGIHALHDARARAGRHGCILTVQPLSTSAERTIALARDTALDAA